MQFKEATSAVRTMTLGALTALLAAGGGVAGAQVEGPVKTQALVTVESKTNTVPAVNQVTVKVNGKATPLAAWRPAQTANGAGVQVAVLIDDGVRQQLGTQIGDLKEFVQGMAPETEVYIGYMRYGTVAPMQEFTTDHAAAAQNIRLPQGSPGVSGSPYFCLSEFVNRWPSNKPAARFVMMITNGVDPYNGSVSPMNQDSPNVQRAQEDAERAGVAVYSIYYPDAGRVMRTLGAVISGQNYLTQVASATGGVAYSQGDYAPVSMLPYLKQFQRAISETYVASFMANADKDRMANVKFSTSAGKTKLRAANHVLPGNAE